MYLYKSFVNQCLILHTHPDRYPEAPEIVVSVCYISYRASETVVCGLFIYSQAPDAPEASEASEPVVLS